ncbi:efflux transporter, RND family, MFP subunit [Thioalkalivibrio sp. K90mix]|uniref:efflux RND transporter periplasmic adaptor subunit n=1 Tax=Thioalkalivibrio sp. (strain K90mix) TaxID=396595 RepID=UPI00019599BB|nr:efflux RND transporter periplasmic adaptor subunit [Thioalkalivibrio sp. K90mix]ADC72812.1 efflux transporter, RND family, MFP subunit [Thioalkalivibrio sp. K90mix]
MKAIGGLLGLVAVVALGVAAWYWFEGESATANGEAQAVGEAPSALDRRTPVRTAVVQPRTFETIVESLGTVQANESVTVTANVTERVVEILFDDGDEVEAGQILVRLDADEAEAALREARVQVDDARRELERVRDRVADGVVTRQQVDQQRSRLSEAEARVAAAEARVANRTIRAPFAGRLGLRQVSPGSLVSPGTPIAELDDIERVKVDFAVPERHAAAIVLGSTIHGRSASGAFEGQVSAVSNRLDVATRTLIVRAAVQNPDLILRPGMLANVRLALDPVERVAIPEGAVQQVADQHFTFRLLDDGTVERVQIRIGRRMPGFAEVLSGIDAGDTVVSEGVSRVRDGQSVRVLPPRVPETLETGEAGTAQ